MSTTGIESMVIRDHDARLEGEWKCPPRARGIVLFAHGSGSSRHSPRNRHVAEGLRAAHFATLLFDLLTPAEDSDPETRFDVPLLARRLLAGTMWSEKREETSGLPIGYFGSSTGAAAALMAAAALQPRVAAVVARGGRPDLAGSSLPQVRAATLFIVGSRDEDVLELNRAAARHLRCAHDIAVIPGATHLFPEPGALEQVEQLATAWFEKHLRPPWMEGARQGHP
jgi:putative phosphoribosyl transferase